MKRQKLYFFVGSLILVTLKTIAQVQDSIYTYNSKHFPLNYKEAYTSKDYIYQESEPGAWTIFLERLTIWILKLLSKSGINSEGANTLKNISYFVIATIAIYVIVKMVLQKDGQWIFKKSKRNSTLVYDSDVETIETTNFGEALKSTLNKQQYRLAVKYYYLWVLQKLAEKELVELTKLKNNSDYQQELESTSFKAPFKNVSYYYNYIWYGEFEIDASKFSQIEPIFQQLLKQLEDEK